MAVLILHAIDCKRVSSGIDAGLIRAVSNTTAQAATVGGKLAPIAGPEGAAIGQALDAASGLLKGIPGLAAEIDSVLGDTDDLYLSTSNQQREGKIWPTNDDYYGIMGGQIVRPKLRIPFSSVIDINLWEYDWFGDDFLGRLTINESESGGVLAKVVASEAEGSIYVIVYSVEK